MQRTLAVLGVGALSLVAFAARPAAAQPSGEFITLDRADSESRLGAFLGILHVEDTGLDEGALRLELHGQYLADSGLGIYGSIPIHQLFLDDADDETALANMEVGALLARAVAPGQEVALRAGITLPTASDSSEGILTNEVAIQTRLTDLVQATPDLITARLGGSLLGGIPGLVYRVDAGLDFPVASTRDDFDVQHDPLLRLNGALGIGVLGAGTLAFELVNVIATGDEDASLSESTLSSAGVSLGVALAGAHVQGGLFLSVDSVFEDDFEEGLITFALGASKSL